MERNVCPYCKQMNRINHSYCTNCGAILNKNRKSGPRLVLLLGDRHDGAYPLQYGENIIGRGSENHITLGDQQISKKHARIYYENEQFWLEDLDSLNGISINGRHLEQKERLYHGCVVKLGSTVLRFEFWLGV